MIPHDFGRLAGRPFVEAQQKDPAEVETNGEFIGVIYEDEDGSFMFEMAILAEDLHASASLGKVKNGDMDVNMACVRRS